MPVEFSKFTSIKRRRRFYVVSVVCITLIFLGLFNLASYFFIKRIGTDIENELDKRLRSNAILISSLIERDLNDLFSPDDQTFVRLELGRAQRNNDLEGVFLIDEVYNVLVDARYEWTLDVSRGYLREDSVYVTGALAGNVTVSPLHIIEGSHFKSVYAPIQDTYGNTAVLVLEGSAAFFEVINTFKRGLIIQIAASAGLLILLTFFLYWALTLLFKTEDQLRRSEQLATMGQMAATVAHEIRNPLGIIKGTADVLREKYEPDDQQDEMFGFIPAEIRRLDRLVNDFLSLSREPQLNLKAADLGATVASAVKVIAPEIEDSGIQVDVQDDGRVPEVIYDEDAIHQVMLNLLLNAIQALNKSGGVIQIKISADKIKRKSVAVVEVADNGPGLGGDPDTVFEPFYTTKTRGTGLGLAVCRRLIEKHNGRIEALSRKNMGTTIRFFLPCA